jgi:hypothetical protein
LLKNLDVCVLSIRFGRTGRDSDVAGAPTDRHTPKYQRERLERRDLIVAGSVAFAPGSKEANRASNFKLQTQVLQGFFQLRERFLFQSRGGLGVFEARLRRLEFSLGVP